VVASSATVTKGSGSGGARADEQDPPIRANTFPSPGADVLDVTLSGRAGIVDRGNVDGLLVEYLQDVSFATLVLRIFASYCFVLNSQIFFDRLFL
jgi:hypothetical protein